jgi:hypothetical protein
MYVVPEGRTLLINKFDFVALADSSATDTFTVKSSESLTVASFRAFIVYPQFPAVTDLTV